MWLWWNETSLVNYKLILNCRSAPRVAVRRVLDDLVLGLAVRRQVLRDLISRLEQNLGSDSIEKLW